MYTPTQWKDHVRAPENRFRVHKIDDDIYEFTPVGEIMQEGTPQDQTHFNNMECGTLDAHAALGILINFFRQLGWGHDEKFSKITNDIEALDAALQAYEGQTDITLADVRNAILTIFNYARWNKWDIDNIKAWISEHQIVQTGTKTLTNTLAFPFNNSKSTVALNPTKENTNYVVLPEVTAFQGNVGEIVISDKAVNGFAIAYTGSASTVTVKYTVLGGYEE